MLEQRHTDAGIETINSTRRQAYGVQCTRLNHEMNAEFPSYAPYEEFQYGAADDFDGDDTSALDVMYGQLDGFASSISGLENVSPSVLHGIMERMKASDRQSILNLQHDVEHRNIVELLKILEDAQCPDYMLQKILQWAYIAKLDGFDFNPKATTRKANIGWMYRCLEQAHQRLPHVISTTLEDQEAAQDIVCFDFGVSLLSMLQDDELMLPQNLVINRDDPTSMYHPKDGKLGEANSGQRYRDLYNQLITPGRNQLLVPIILYLDGTAIDSKGHIEICPVSFTTSLFTEKVRRDSGAWRVLGYVPDLNRGRSGAMNQFANSTSEEGKGRTTRNFHKVMDAMMRGMVEAQAGKDCRLKKVPLKLCGKWIVFDIVCPLLFVINDGKQGDQLCGRMNGHHSSMNRHHRSCDCLFDDLDNPDVECTFLDVDTINDICRNGSDDDLQELTIYKVDNAFNRIQMGQNAHGIFMCAVIDVMHTIQHGIIMYCLESFKKGISNESLAKLDGMAFSFDKTCRQTIRSSFPRTDFSRGITNLSQVECSEQSGTLFLLAALTMQVEGWHLLERHFADMEAVLGTIECLLCFEAWLDQFTFWDVNDTTGEADKAEAAIASLMRLIVKYLPRLKGNGWKVSKFHEIKHIVRFIGVFGAPRGYNASRPEEHHKAHAKRPGRRSQKDMNTIDQQCARRIADTIVIDTMHGLFQERNVLGSVDKNRIDTPTYRPLYVGINTDGDNPAIEEGRGTMYCIRSFRDPENGDHLVRDVKFTTQTRGPMHLEDNLSMFIIQYYGSSDLDEQGEGSIACCTEYHKTDSSTKEKMICIRCHPNFRAKGYPWYDWALIQFELSTGVKKDFPCRVVACVPRQTDNGFSFDLIVQSCYEPTGRESFLFTEWSFRKDFHVVSATALVALCLVLCSSDLNGDVLVVNDRDKWPSYFYEAANVEYNMHD